MELARENQIWGFIIQGSMWTWISTGMAGNPRLAVHWLIAYSLPGEALVSTSFKPQNLIRSWFKKKKTDPPKKNLGNDWRHSVYRLGFKWYWDITNFLRCKSSILVPWENLLIFRRYMLKYLEVKFYDACNLLWDGSEGRKRARSKLGKMLTIAESRWVHYTILLNSLYFTGWHNKKLWGKALNKHPICWFGAD